MNTDALHLPLPQVEAQDACNRKVRWSETTSRGWTPNRGDSWRQLRGRCTVRGLGRLAYSVLEGRQKNEYDNVIVSMFVLRSAFGSGNMMHLVLNVQQRQICEASFQI